MSRSFSLARIGEVLRVLLMAVGVATVLGLLWHIGPGRVVDTLRRLAPASLPLLVLPSVLIYLVDTLGWRATLRHRAAIPLWKLFAIRMAGEAVNLTTATGYVGGEPVKSYLLMRDRVPGPDAIASVVTAKTTMTLAQVAFMLLGLALAAQVTWDEPYRGKVQALLYGIGAAIVLLVLALGVIVVLQRRGMMRLLLALLRRLGLRSQWCESRADGMRDVDRLLAGAYRDGGRAFWASVGWFGLGWLLESVEVYVMLACLDAPPAVLDALVLAALSVAVKASTFFIPGSIGAQEGGNVLLAVAYGYSDSTGMAFALLRRLREVVWVVIGLLCLSALGRPTATRASESPAARDPLV